MSWRTPTGSRRGCTGSPATRSSTTTGAGRRGRSCRPAPPATSSERADESPDEPAAEALRRELAACLRPLIDRLPERPARGAGADRARGPDPGRGRAAARDLGLGREGARAARPRAAEGRCCSTAATSSSTAAAGSPSTARAAGRASAAARRPDAPRTPRSNRCNDRLERVLDELVQLTPGLDSRAISDATRSWSRISRKTYPDGTEAVRGVTFRVAAGECYGLLGPNGAGKSTTVGMLGTLVRPTSGRASVAGFDVVAAAARGAPPDRLRDAGGRRRRVRDRARAARPAGAAARAPARRVGAPRGAAAGAGRPRPTWPTSAWAGSRAACSGASISPPSLMHLPRGRLPGRADRGPGPARARGDLGRARPARERSSASRSC